VVVCHLAVQRILYAHFMGTPMSEIPYLNLPKHVVSAWLMEAGPEGWRLMKHCLCWIVQVIELTPGPFGCKDRKIPLFERCDALE
jgi:broad specificity phosphatase PhoE